MDPSVLMYVLSPASVVTTVPFCAPTLEVEALLLFHRSIPEVGGLIRSARVLASLTGQDDLFLVSYKRAVGVYKGSVLYEGYGELVTYYQVLIMFALVVKLLPLTLNFPLFRDPGPPLRFDPTQLSSH
jgi:hypothetical protein